jgi:nanoRNase/pAp phosphatase (c-di-AMP/oligoRNAs hydrolase)
MKIQKHKFDEIFESWEGGTRVSIFGHPNPDPDSMGSCLGIKWLLKSKYGVESDIYIDGDYSARRQNMAMVNILDIKFMKMSEYKKGGYAIVVDSTHKRLPEKIAEDVKIVIDHHSVVIAEENCDYVLNQKCGSCATLVFGIMQELECIPGKSDMDAVIATAMLEGIRSDTDVYRREETTVDDFRASATLFQLADIDMINQIERCRLPRYHFELRGTMMEDGNNEIVNGSTFIACVGFLSNAKMSSIPILADEVVQEMEGISTSIIYGIVEDRIELSMRSHEVSMEVNRFLQKHFGDYAGAKYGSGGASIPLGVFGMPNPPAELKKSIYETTKAVIMTVLSRDVKSE